MNDEARPVQKDLATIRDALERAGRGEPGAIEGLLADDVEWHEIGRAEPIRGRDALIAHLSRDTGWHIVPFIHDVLASDDHVVALIKSHASRGEHTLNYKVVEIYHLRDGKITARWAFSDDTEAIARFFG
jgi:ketosteroid isomerase-like protein